MADSDVKEKTSDTVSVDSDVSATVKIFCSCKRQTCRKFWCSFNHYWRLSVLFTAVALYLIFGALIFSAVEGPSEQRRIEQVQRDRAEALNNLTEMVMNLTNLTEEEALNVTLTFVALGEIASSSIPEEESPIWDYSSAFFFSTTVITTIGYGTIAPTTNAGRIIFMFYAVFGIPLALVFLAQIGSIIDKFVHASLRPLKKRWGAKASRSLAVAMLFMVTIVFFILIPGAIFSAVETWTYLESVYYSVVSLTTVGFGDFVPAQAGVRATSVVIRLYKFMNSAWLWIGLAMVSALITEMQGVIEALGKWLHTHNCCGMARKYTLEKLKMASMNTATKEASETSGPETST